MRLRIIPQEAKFFDQFEQHVDNLLRGYKALQDLVDTFENIEAKVNIITEREAEGDRITHTIIEQVNKTFVTPFDREDILALASALDDVMDRMQAAADAMLIYNIKQPTRAAQELTEILGQSVEELKTAMPFLRQRDKMPRILKHCIEINRLENEGDKVHRQAVIKLFAQPRDALEVVTWKEIYEQLESASDACEDVADVLQGMVMKNA